MNEPTNTQRSFADALQEHVGTNASVRLARRMLEHGHQVSRTTTWKWCTGRTVPKRSNLSALLDALGLSAEQRQELTLLAAKGPCRVSTD